MSTNYSTDEVLDIIRTALKKVGYSIRKPQGIGIYGVYNDRDGTFKPYGGVDNIAALLNAIGGEIEHYGNSEILYPLYEDELADSAQIPLCCGDYATAYARIAQEWRNSDNPDELGFFEEHKAAVELFDLIVNERERLNDPALLEKLYEADIPHIMRYKMDLEAETEVGELASIIHERGFELVPNKDGYSFRENNGYIHPTVFYGTHSAMDWLNVERELANDIALVLGTNEYLEPIDAIKRVEALAEIDPPLFDRLVSAAARLDTINRFCDEVKISQLAVFEDLPKEPKNSIQIGGNSYYCGIEGVEFIYHNEWADPELRYKGKNYSVVDVEDAFFHDYEDEVSAGKFDGDFSAYLFDHADEVRALLDELNPLEKTAPKKHTDVERD